MTEVTNILKSKMDADNYRRLAALENEKLNAFIADAVALCEPADVFVADDSPEAVQQTRDQALAAGEEKPLETRGHTVHFDGMEDQGRDREVTRYLVPEGETLSPSLNQAPRGAGLEEIRGLLAGSMRGRTMIVRLMTLGPNNSVFSIPCVECTDSWYVSHSLNLLYRLGYEDFKRMQDKSGFFAILHSCGKIDDRMISVESDKKRIYIDYSRETVYSVNTQYAGNTVGLKKLALRLAIQKADREGWLAEHMFLMGVKGKGGRKSYFAGAFPSACGKTSTAMLPGEQIMCDDIAYFRAMDGRCMAANAESGIFGIIQNVSAKSDPAIWDVLTKPGEVIFSNILVKDKKPYWLGMGCDTPDSGENFSGAWTRGKKNAQGQEIPLAHKNARYAVRLGDLANCDPELGNPGGVKLDVIIYGGRDLKAYVPVQQSYDWDHGIVAYGAALETETTFATVGQEGVPEINMMSIQDFVAIPFGEYIQNDLDFGKKLTAAPVIFGVNYFLCGPDGKFLNGVRDKHVWIRWMELRIHGDAGAVRAPTGLLPKYQDLAPLFRSVLDKEYPEADYLTQFTIRVPENLAKMERAEAYYRKESCVHDVVFQILADQRGRLLAAQKEFGDYITPNRLPEG
ncbi:MAG: phosphoenolpyruvate carboxykinase (GTP) [PVC group bacterium]